MLHKFFEPGMWFRPKLFGYGAGLPIVWQGWVFLTLHMMLCLGIALGFHGRPMLMVPLILCAALVPLPIYAARTQGGWKWRWGSYD